MSRPSVTHVRVGTWWHCASNARRERASRPSSSAMASASSTKPGGRSTCATQRETASASATTQPTDGTFPTAWSVLRLRLDLVLDRLILAEGEGLLPLCRAHGDHQLVIALVNG